MKNNNRRRPQKILLLNSQFVELYISGFTNRFIGLWCYLQKRKKDSSDMPEVHWLTNRSLWKKYFNSKTPPNNVTVMTANLKFFKYTSRLFYPFFVVYTYYRNKCTSVHVATSIVNTLYLVRLFNFLKIPYCFTIGANSIDMATYDSERMKSRWKKLFLLAKNVDVLNPTNSIVVANGTKFISPTSFPYLVEVNNIPESKFTLPGRRNIILFSASFVPQKNPLFAIIGFEKFLQQFSDEFPDATLVIIGKGQLYNEMAVQVTQINSLYQRQAIQFGKEEDMVDWLSVSKIFLSLQDYDNYPSQSLMEAMIFCNAIISIDNGDTRKLVVEEFDNVLLHQKDPDLLAAAIKEILTGWELNFSNRNHILTRFSAAEFARYFFNIHDKIS